MALRVLFDDKWKHTTLLEIESAKYACIWSRLPCSADTEKSLRQADRTPRSAADQKTSGSLASTGNNSSARLQAEMDRVVVCGLQ